METVCGALVARRVLEEVLLVVLLRVVPRTCGDDVSHDLLACGLERLLARGECGVQERAAHPWGRSASSAPRR